MKKICLWKKIFNREIKQKKKEKKITIARVLPPNNKRKTDGGTSCS